MPNDDRETRYSQSSDSGENEPKEHERKEQRPHWQPRQGGDQTPEAKPRIDDHLEPPIDPEERPKVR